MELTVGTNYSWRGGPYDNACDAEVKLALPANRELLFEQLAALQSNTSALSLAGNRLEIIPSCVLSNTSLRYFAFNSISRCSVCTRR
jgi:hypothetical protein